MNAVTHVLPLSLSTAPVFACGPARWLVRIDDGDVVGKTLSGTELRRIAESPR